MKAGRKASEQVVNAVSPNPSVVHVGGDTSFHLKEKDGRHTINIATDYFDDSSLDKTDKVEIMLGLATHEAAHAAYTDDKVKMAMLENEPAETRDLKKDIWNIIED